MTFEDTKGCTKCGQLLPRSLFTAERRNRSGLKSWCKPCCSAHIVNRCKADPSVLEKRRAYTAARRQDPLIAEKSRASAAAWNAANKARHLENVRRWKSENQDAVAAYCAVKKGKRLLRKVAWADNEAIVAVYRQARELTEQTGMQWDVDHIVPLLGRRISGLHVHTNLQVMLATTNRKKSNSYDNL